MALIPEEFLNSVVAIGVLDSNQKKHWIGTGFVFAYFKEQTSENKKKYSFYIVTNKHVIRNQKQIIFRFSADNNGPAKDFPVQLIRNMQQVWTGHPDPNIDVAVINFNITNVKNHGTKIGFFRSDSQVMHSQKMKENGIYEGGSVFAMGYPMGLVNVDRQYVIVRNGSIARIRDMYDKLSRDFIVDAFVFPGNSGGPVLSKPEGIGIKGTTINTTSALIGMVKSYITYKDIAYSKQTGRTRMIFEENTGLTSVIPVDYILETIQLDITSKQKKGIHEKHP